MLWVAFADKTGSGLWAGAAALYFTYVTGLSAPRVGILIALSGALGIVGAPLGGVFADRFPLTRVLAATQILRAAAALALLTTDAFLLLLLFSALGSLGDRSSSVLTKLYATRVAGPRRARYQALSRTSMNIGFGVGGLIATGALAAGTDTAYRALLVGDAVSYLVVVLLVLRCSDISAPGRTVAPADGTPRVDRHRDRPQNPWRDRGYLLYTATETVLFVDDAVFKVGLPLWIIHATDAPHGLAPLLLVLNNVLVVAFQLPLARYGATPHTARAVLFPLAAAFASGAGCLALSATSTTWLAVTTLTVAAVAFTAAEMLHATVSWELSVALAPTSAQGAYLGVHGLAAAGQRSLGPLAVTAVVTAGPVGWAVLGAVLATTCLGQHRLVRERLTRTALSVPTVTVSEN
ncbi:MFS transporter [Streptomyces tsukubensis]|uniref:MFS transporter n=2 Tax=Streptomyces tsukubensis TaxID=83656 RepID=A0A1V4A0B7_9ACTN|nr:MFS transporter [Streptomyces tsukubensis]QFR97526.1 MFS transporter [Streptomyces tsukubensis]